MQKNFVYHLSVYFVKFWGPNRKFLGRSAHILKTQTLHKTPSGWGGRDPLWLLRVKRLSLCKSQLEHMIVVTPALFPISDSHILGNFTLSTWWLQCHCFPLNSLADLVTYRIFQWVTGLFQHVLFFKLFQKLNVSFVLLLKINYKLRLFCIL